MRVDYPRGVQDIEFDDDGLRQMAALAAMLGIPPHLLAQQMWRNVLGRRAGQAAGIAFRNGAPGSRPIDTIGFGLPEGTVPGYGPGGPVSMADPNRGAAQPSSAGPAPTRQGPDYRAMQNAAMNRGLGGMRTGGPMPQRPKIGFRTQDALLGLVPALFMGKDGDDYVASYLQGKMQGGDQKYGDMVQNWDVEQRQTQRQSQADLAEASFYGDLAAGDERRAIQEREIMLGQGRLAEDKRQFDATDKTRRDIAEMNNRTKSAIVNDREMQRKVREGSPEERLNAMAWYRANDPESEYAGKTDEQLVTLATSKSPKDIQAISTASRNEASATLALGRNKREQELLPARKQQILSIAGLNDKRAAEVAVKTLYLDDKMASEIAENYAQIDNLGSLMDTRTKDVNIKYARLATDQLKAAVGSTDKNLQNISQQINTLTNSRDRLVNARTYYKPDSADYKDLTAQIEDAQEGIKNLKTTYSDLKASADNYRGALKARGETVQSFNPPAKETHPAVPSPAQGSGGSAKTTKSGTKYRIVK